MNKYQLFEVSLYSLNILSFIIGMFVGAAMWRTRSFTIVVIYFAYLALHYGLVKPLLEGRY